MHKGPCAFSPGKPRWDYHWASWENGAPQRRKWALCDHVVMWSHTHDPLLWAQASHRPSHSGPGARAWVFQKHLRATGWQKTCSLSVSRPWTCTSCESEGEGLILTLVAKLSGCPQWIDARMPFLASYKRRFSEPHSNLAFFLKIRMSTTVMCPAGFLLFLLFCVGRGQGGEGWGEECQGKSLALWLAPGTPWSQAFHTLEQPAPSLYSHVQLVSKDSALVDSVKMFCQTFVRSYLTATFVGWVEIYPPRVLNHSRAGFVGWDGITEGFCFLEEEEVMREVFASSLIILARVKISFHVQVCPSELLHPQVLRLSWVTGQEHTLQ